MTRRLRRAAPGFAAGGRPAERAGSGAVGPSSKIARAPGESRVGGSESFAAGGKPTHAFTLIELVIVIGLVGVFVSLVTAGYQSWERTSQLQQAVSETMALLRRASTRARHDGEPYKVQYDASARTVTGFGWSLDGSKLSARFESDAVVTLPREVAVTSPSGGASWIVDAGGGIVSEKGEPLASQDLEIAFSITVAGQPKVRRLVLESDGDLSVQAEAAE